ADALPPRGRAASRAVPPRRIPPVAGSHRARALHARIEGSVHPRAHGSGGRAEAQTAAGAVLGDMEVAARSVAPTVLFQERFAPSLSWGVLAAQPPGAEVRRWRVASYTRGWRSSHFARRRAPRAPPLASSAASK